MTTGGVTTRLNQQRVERRLIPPFGDGAGPNALSRILDGVLAKCRFAPFEGVATEEQDTYVLSIDESERPVIPRFCILVEQMDELSKRLDVQSEDLVVGLSIRSQYMRRYDVLARWDMDVVPSDEWSPDPEKLERFQSGRGMDFVLGVQVASSRERLIRQGLGPGKVLCRKVFSVRAPAANFSFPFRWVEFGGDTPYPEEALWVIDWNDTDGEPQFDRPVDQVLTVLVNKKAEVPLRTMGDIRGGNKLAWRMLAADIITQIWADILSKSETEPDKDDTESLLGQVFARLSRASNLPYSEIKGLVEQDDSLTYLRNMVAKILKVVA